MSEKDFLPKGFKEFLYDPYGSGAEKGKSLQESGRISLTTFTMLNTTNMMYQFDEKFRENLYDFLSENNPSNFETRLNGLVSSIESIEGVSGEGLEQSEKQMLTLISLSAKLDLLEIANYRSHEIYNSVKRSIDSTFKSIFKNCKEDEILDLINNSIFTQCFGGLLKLESESSQYFAKSFIENYKGRFNAIPDIGDYGNPYCVLLAANRKGDNLEFLEKNMNPEDLIAYSSNSGHKLPKERKSTLFEERANGTENTFIERGNLNYMAELVRFYSISNYPVTKEEDAALKYKNPEMINPHFFKMLEKLNEYILENRNNSGKIKEINYMLNCPIYISTGNCTTLADFVNNEIKFNKKLTEEQRAIFEKFAGIIGIEQNKQPNVSGLKLMTSSEVIEEYGEENTVAVQTIASPEFMLAAYGFKSMDRDKLERITVDEKIFKLLSEQGLQNFSGLTLTPIALQTAEKTTGISLNDIKIKTKDQEISESCFRTMILHEFKDFSGVIFVGDFSADSKKQIADMSGFSKVSEAVIKQSREIGVFTSKSKIGQITKDFDKMLDIINKFKPSDFLIKPDELNSTRSAIEKYSKSNWFMRIFRRNSVKNSIKKFSKTMDFINNRNTRNTDQENAKQFGRATATVQEQLLGQEQELVSTKQELVNTNKIKIENQINK